MPITIPSKNIYGSPKINRIKDNKIETVEFKHFVATRETQKDTSVGVFESDAIDNAYNTSYDFAYSQDGYPAINGYLRKAKVFSYSQIMPYVSPQYFLIPIVQDKKTITDVFGGKSDDGEYKISVSFSGKIRRGKVYFDATFPKNAVAKDVTAEDVIDWSSIRYYRESSEPYENFDQKTEFDSYTIDQYDVPYPNMAPTVATSTPKIEFDVKDRGEEVVNKVEDDGHFRVYIKLLYSGYRLTRLGGRQYVAVNVSTQEEEPTPIEEELYGEFEEYFPQKAKISVNGNMIVLNLQEATASYGNGSNPYTIGGNELMQNTTVVSDDDRSYAEVYSERILEQYKDGKGTAEINCSIFPVTLDDSTESLVIPIGSSVIPMYMKPNGEDAPIFAEADGTPIPCRVIGSEVYYDGATMQRLTIKEM